MNLFLFILTIYCSYISHAKAELQFHKSVPVEKRERLLSDLDYLKNLNLKDFTSVVFPKNLKSGEDLKFWFLERIHHVIWETFSISDSLYSTKLDQSFKYPEGGDKNPYINSYFISSLSGEILFEKFNKILKEESNRAYVPSAHGLETVNRKSDAKVMAGNFAGIYQNGKKNNLLMAVKLGETNQDYLLYHSTRTGLMVVGENLYGNSENIDNLSYQISNRAKNLLILLHEARHSDGNGENAGFSHSLCPMFHEMEDEDACDSATNGAYQVSLEILKLFISNIDNLIEFENSKRVVKLNNRQLEKEKEVLLLTLKSQLSDIEGRLFLRNTYYGKKLKKGSQSLDEYNKINKALFELMALKSKQLSHREKPLEDILFKKEDFSDFSKVLDSLPTGFYNEITYSSEPESIIEVK